MEINYLIQNLESLLIKYSNNKSQVEENLHELISGLEVKSINSEIETFAAVSYTHLTLPTITGV